MKVQANLELRAAGASEHLAQFGGDLLPAAPDDHLRAVCVLGNFWVARASPRSAPTTIAVDSRVCSFGLWRLAPRGPPVAGSCDGRSCRLGCQQNLDASYHNIQPDIAAEQPNSRTA